LDNGRNPVSATHTETSLRSGTRVLFFVALPISRGHVMKLLPPLVVFILAHLLVIGGAIVVASQSELREVLLAVAGGRP
jgi:hypothetical protein